MDRSTRFLWSLECGKKDRRLFAKAMKRLVVLLEVSQEISLITDGERRYGSTLFEICYQVLKSGKRGRPQHVLPKGMKVRVKNKGSRTHTRGRKPKKIQAPQKEHPETEQNLEDSSVHANHLEAFNAALRRKCAAFRRKTNTYAKSKETLQLSLDMFWCLHNFVNKHFTTKKVPAVAIGIIQQPLSIEQLMKIKLPNY